MGAVVLTIATARSPPGFSTLGWALGLLVAALALLAAATGFCTGCEIYRLGARLRGVGHGELRRIDRADVGGGGGELVVHFTHPLCSDCLAVERRLRAEGRTLVTVDVRRRPDLARKYGIGIVPTAVAVAADGAITAAAGLTAAAGQPSARRRSSAAARRAVRRAVRRREVAGRGASSRATPSTGRREPSTPSSSAARVGGLDRVALGPRLARPGVAEVGGLVGQDVRGGDRPPRRRRRTGATACTPACRAGRRRSAAGSPSRSRGRRTRRSRPGRAPSPWASRPPTSTAPRPVRPASADATRPSIGSIRLWLEGAAIAGSGWVAYALNSGERLDPERDGNRRAGRREGTSAHRNGRPARPRGRRRHRHEARDARTVARPRRPVQAPAAGALERGRRRCRGRTTIRRTPRRTDPQTASAVRRPSPWPPSPTSTTEATSAEARKPRVQAPSRPRPAAEPAASVASIVRRHVRTWRRPATKPTQSVEHEKRAQERPQAQARRRSEPSGDRDRWEREPPAGREVRRRRRRTSSRRRVEHRRRERALPDAGREEHRDARGARSAAGSARRPPDARAEPSTPRSPPAPTPRRRARGPACARLRAITSAGHATQARGEQRSGETREARLRCRPGGPVALPPRRRSGVRGERPRRGAHTRAAGARPRAPTARGSRRATPAARDAAAPASANATRAPPPTRAPARPTTPRRCTASGRRGRTRSTAAARPRSQASRSPCPSPQGCQQPGGCRIT